MGLIVNEQRTLSLAVILVALAGVTASQLASVGVAHDPTTAQGDLIAHGPDAGLVRVAIGATDGGVLTSVNGAPVWAAAPAVSLPAAGAAGEMLVASGAGTSYTATGASTVRASLDTTRSSTPLVSASWTTANVGVGTGTLVGGAFTGAAANGAGGAGNAGGDTRWTAPPLSRRWEMVFRVAKTGSSSGEWVALIYTYTGATFTAWRVNASGTCQYNYGSGSSGTIPFPVDGTGWLLVRYDDASVVFAHGTGTTSTPPTSWTYDAADEDALAGRAVPPSSIYIACRTNAGLVLDADSTWTVDNLTVRDLSLGGL